MQIWRGWGYVVDFVGMIFFGLTSPGRSGIASKANILGILSCMAHLNLYVPDELAASLKREAQAARVPLSRHVLTLLAARDGDGFLPSDYFVSACGFLTEEMAEPMDPLPEAVDDLDGLQ